MSSRTMTKAALALLAATAFTAFAAPAYANGCPTGMEGQNQLLNAPMMPKDVTDTILGAIDLNKEVNFADHQLRTRFLVVQPGGIVPLHSHGDRPALIYTISGSITEYRSNCTVPIEHRAGDIAHESDGISHYWVNHGDVPAVLLSSDVYHVSAHDHNSM